MSLLVGGRVSEGSDFYTFESTVCLSKARFICLVACYLLLFVKAVCLFLKKSEHIVTYISIHTIQLIFLIQIATIFFGPFFFLGGGGGGGVALPTS